MGGSTPNYQQPAASPDELILAQKTAIQNQQAMQADARADTARLMAIYGTKLALGGSGGGSPLVNGPAPMQPAGGGVNVDMLTPQVAGVF